jgi:hypothetical protein
MKYKSAAAMERKFNNKKSVLDYFDAKNSRRPRTKCRRVTVYFPEWMIESLDREADKLGVARQAIIKMMISERIKAA